MRKHNPESEGRESETIDYNNCYYDHYYYVLLLLV